MKKYAFYLGGHDLEMLTIKELIQREMPSASLYDNNLSWGARVSDYRTELELTLKKNEFPVLVELEWVNATKIELTNADKEQLSWENNALKNNCLDINHHNERAGTNKPTALHAIFELLSLPEQKWTRHLELVAANDRGHIQAMKELGASLEEITKIRRADRHAQGVTEEQETAAMKAIAAKETLENGGLTVVRLPHNRTSIVTDMLDIALGGSGFDNLVVVSPGEVNFYGNWPLIEILNQRFIGGWSGGSRPVRGFWGTTSHHDAEAIIRCLRESLQK